MPASEILTERLCLRPPVIDDATEIFARYGQDPVVTRYLSWSPQKTVADAIGYLEKLISDTAQGRRYGFLIFSLQSGQLLGSVGGAIENHFVQFGYCLARDAWGRGFATEAATEFLRAAQKLPGICRIQAFCDVENRASARVLEKIGLEREGTLRRYMMTPNMGAEPRDVHLYAKVGWDAARSVG
jgi:RimJ/RimL family protein N-acetyltransferase